MLNSSYYRVTITPLLPVGEGGGSYDGFIDHRSVPLYMQPDAEGNVVAPTDYDASLRKTRGNLRYLNMMNSIHLMGNAYLSNQVYGDDEGNPVDVNTEGSNYAFTVFFERDEYVYTPNELFDPNQPESETNRRQLYGADAVKRTIARSFLTRRTMRGSIYDPNATTGVRDGAGYTGANFARNPIYTDDVDILPLADDLAAAEAAITVEKVQNISFI